MRGKHTVEKIGGTSMSRFKEVIDNLIVAKLKPNEYYNRIFVVSAYGGITNMLLEHKKSGVPGVYAYFSNGNEKWEKSLEEVREKMISINHSFENIGLDTKKADAFINERVDGIKNCLRDLIKIRSYGHLSPDNYLPPSREFLSAIGEAHSAFNSTLILQKHGVDAVFVDLTGWKETKTYPINKTIEHTFSKIDLCTELPIVTWLY